MQWILIALGVLLAVVAVFALQNSEVVTIRFLNLETDASVLVVILLSAIPVYLANRISSDTAGCRKAGASVVALSAQDGSTVWTSGDEPASYCFALPLTFGGRRCAHRDTCRGEPPLPDDHGRSGTDIPGAVELGAQRATGP